MLVRYAVVVLCVSLAACALEQPPPSTSQLPPGFYGTWVDNDLGAINDASYALGSPARTHNDPVEALRAAIAVEYLGGEVNTAERWFRMSPITKMQMLEARAEMRQALGIRPDAPSQLVVNVLIAAMVDLMHDNQAAAMHVFASPLFGQPPERTWAVLNDLPYMPAARVATSDAELQLYREE
ncbi:MAG TPA: hypothetical protein VMB34_10420 [Acetobacteraceae bacterium]|nr:hypothetical protein [Acetobacteraceae bacterium]